MFAELGLQPSACSVALHYQDLLSGFVYDQADLDLTGDIQALGIANFATDTIMKTPQKRAELAKEVIEFGINLLKTAG
jgi:LPPG:FO 2-phospho-L-lactate transferase